MSTLTSKSRYTVLGTPSPFFHLLELDVAEIDQHPAAIQKLRDGQLTGIIIHGVYDQEFLQQITRRLERHDPAFIKSWFPEKFRSWFYGQNLNLLETNADAYFQEVPRFHQMLQELFSSSLSPDPHVTNILSRLDQNRPYRPAPGPEPDQNYMLLTLRGHAEGGYLPAHVDNEQALRPTYEHLQTLVSRHMYSTVLLLSAPDDGGELQVFDYRVEPQHSRLISDDSVRQKPDLSTLSSVSFQLKPGDLIVLDSGRYLHRVTPVIGPTIRWTACSFMAHAIERDAVYCWG